MRVGHVTSKTALCLALVALLVGATALAFAVPEKEILRINIQQNFTGVCCFSWGETVSVTEPPTPSAVIVTLATDFELESFQNFTVGLMVNGGPCRLDLGPTRIGQAASDHRGFDSASLEWTILPSDGLLPGNNSFTLCGGGPLVTSTITLANNTMTATISK